MIDFDLLVVSHVITYTEAMSIDYEDIERLYNKFLRYSNASAR